MSIRDALNKSGTADPFAGMLYVDEVTIGDYTYYGFMSPNGAWIIKKVGATSARFAGGASGYEAAFAVADTLIYTYPDK